MKSTILLLIFLCGVCLAAGCLCPDPVPPCPTCPSCPVTPCPTCPVPNCIQPMKTIIIEAPMEGTSYSIKAFINPDKKIGILGGLFTNSMDGTWEYDPSNNARILFTVQHSGVAENGFIELYDNHKSSITISTWPLKALGTWSQ
jgi:hypothetical protein